MKSIKKLTTKFPIITSVLFAAIFYGILRLASLIARNIPLGGSEYRAELVYELAASLLITALTLLIGNKDVFTRRRTGFFKGLIPAAYFIGVNIYSGITQISLSVASKAGLQPPIDILCYILTMALIGVTEEFAFRGIIAENIFEKYGKSPAGVWLATIVSGFIFGFFHIINIWSVGGVWNILAQCIFATFMGMNLCAIYYRTRNIWVNVFVHAFVDFCGLITSGIFVSDTAYGIMQSYTLLQVYGALPYLALTLVILRPSKMREILGTYRKSTDKETLAAALTAILIGVVIAATCILMVPYTIKELPNILDSFKPFFN